MPWALSSVGARRPARSRGARIAWTVAMLLVCLPVAVPSAHSAVTTWHAGAPASDVLAVSVLAVAFGALSLLLLLALVRMVVLRWDGPTWRDAPGG